MIPRKSFLYFLLDTPTGKAYYRTIAGAVAIVPITAGAMDVSLQDSPATWLQTVLSFDRNAVYHGINRSYGTPQEFVRDADAMVTELFMKGPATETPLTLAVFKYDADPLPNAPTYELYYKGNLDLQKISGIVLESVSAPLMEGGIGQLLKSYENTVIEIPCDGSIIENIKVNLDGQLVPDTFYYQIQNVKANGWNASFLPTTFINNEADNYGIVRGNPFLQNVGDDASMLESSNYLLYSTAKIRVHLKGHIVVKNGDPDFGNPFRLYTRNQFPMVPGVSGHQIDLVTGPVATAFGLQGNLVRTTTRFDFDIYIDLEPYEKLFLVFYFLRKDGNDVTELISGNVSLSFNSAYESTRVWALEWADLYRLLVEKICQLASTTAQTFDYEAVSNLLDANRRLVITSGDALRASGDPTYQRYYYINAVGDTSFGPVIKTTLKDCYQAAEAHFCASLGVSRGTDGEALYLETMQTVYNSDTDTFDLGEVSKLKWNWAEDVAVSDFEIGYVPVNYDQKSGKYEPNTTLQMKAPINSFEAKLSKISKYRADSYGIERLRSNLGNDATSSTRNDSDNGIFKLDTDLEGTEFDYSRAKFVSLLTNPVSTSNTNQEFIPAVPHQPISLPVTEGEYFKPQLDQAIFIFSKVGYAATEASNLTISGIVNSVNKPPDTPPDSVTIKLWLNGVVLFEQTTVVGAVNTPININYNFSQAFAYKGCLYITASTTLTAEANINTVDLTIGAYVSMSGANIPIQIGTPQLLLSMPTVIPDNDPFDAASVVNYNYQYFVFNSIVPNTNFTLDFSAYGFLGGENSLFEIEVYINGVLQPEKISIFTTPILNQPFLSFLPTITRDYTLNDIVLLVATPVGSNLQVELTTATLTWRSTYITVRKLRRLAYLSLQGIPNIATDDLGNLSTIVAGAPYNVELSPKVMYNNWKDYIKSTFFDVVTGPMTFQTLSKNPYLRRTLPDGKIIIENANEPITGNRMFWPIEVELDAAMPIGFAKLMSGIINAHVKFTFLGVEFYFFPGHLSQQPALNETQTLRGLLSPKTNLLNFVNILQFRIPDMAPNSINTAVASSVQFVPINEVLNPLYHTYDRDKFLFTQQIQHWFAKDGYAQPVQVGDEITLQHITRDLDPIFYRVFNCDGTLYAGPQNLDTIPANGVVVPYVLWQKVIDTTGWPEGCYYIIISSPTAGDLIISECQDVRIEQVGTVLFEARNSFNSQSTIFKGSTLMVWKMRVAGFYDNRTKHNYESRTFIDQGQDIRQLNAVAYEVMNLTIGSVPDYVTKKLLRYLLMDGTTIDGEGFGLEEGAAWEEVFTTGAPKKIQSIEIRPTRNRDSISVIGGVTDTDNSMIVTVNASAFGPNVSNASGTTDTDLIEITVVD